LNKILETIQTYSSAFFAPPKKKTRWFNAAWCVLLVIAGAVLWAKFLNFGNIPFDFHDWAEINAPRLAFVKDAVERGLLPLHMNDASALRNITDRYLCLPDAIFTPQLFLLKFMSVGQFVLLDTLLLYGLGAWGLIKLKQRFRLSPFTFGMFFFLYNLNGHLLAHFSIGHITWVGAFLFSWFILLIVDLLDGDQRWAWVAKMAGLLFVIYLQGSFHQFIWCLLFLGFLAISHWKSFWTIIKAGLFAGLLSLIRLLPPMLLLSQFDDEFLGGYPTLLDALKSFVVIVPPEQSLDVRSMLSNLGWWEYDFYIGLMGALFLLVFGLVFWGKKLLKNKGPYPQLVFPMLALAVLSIGRIYRLLRFVPIPVFSGERASIRMLLLPVMFLMLIAAVMCQKWINKRHLEQNRCARWVGYTALLLLVHDLWQHLKVWQVSNAFTAFPETPVDLTIKLAANHPDPQYFTLLWIGASASLLTMLVLGFLVLREKRKPKE
jgi:hypothetical protein